MSGELVSAPTIASVRERIDGIADTLVDTARSSEVLGHLDPVALDALVATGAFRVAWPAELGGPGAGLRGVIEVVEATARIDLAAAWNLSIGTTTTGIVGAYVSDAAVHTIFADPDVIIAGQVAPMGTAEFSDGGLRVAGAWMFGSGIIQASWVLGGCLLAGADGSAQQVLAVFPAGLVDIDRASWDVAGLAGTGSYDYRVDDAFVPDGYWFDAALPPRRRGGVMYDVPIPGQVMTHHSAIALGAAAQALELITAIAVDKVRAYSNGTVARREVFQTQLARHELSLCAAQWLVRDAADRLETSTATENALAMVIEVRAISTFVTDLAVEIVDWAYRSGGGAALRSDHRLQRLLRDIYGATQHAYVDPASVTDLGAMRLGVGS